VFKKIREVEVAAICDKQVSIATNVAQRFGIKQHYKELPEMLKQGLDVVDICTPPRTHAQLAAEAMESGCHVLIEKPLAMNLQEVDEMVSISLRNNVKLCVVHQNLFNPVVQRARNLYENGKLGELVAVEAATYVRRDNAMCANGQHWCHTLPGGIFFEILPHPVYLLQLFLNGIEPTCVQTDKLGKYDWMPQDEARTLLKADEGVGTLVASCNSPFHGDSLTIACTKLALEIDLWGRSMISYEPRTEDPYSVGINNMRLASQFFRLIGTTMANSLTTTFGGVRVSAHYGFISSFVRSIQNDLELPVPMNEAKENVRIVEEICKQIGKNA